MSYQEVLNKKQAQRRAEDEKLARYLTKLVKAAMDKFVGTPMTETALRAIRATLNGIALDLDRMVSLPFMFHKEVYASLRVDGPAVHVTWLPRTQRAAAFMWDLKNASQPDAGERPLKFFDSLGRELPDALT